MPSVPSDAMKCNGIIMPQRHAHKNARIFKIWKAMQQITFYTTYEDAPKEPRKAKNRKEKEREKENRAQVWLQNPTSILYRRRGCIGRALGFLIKALDIVHAPVRQWCDFVDWLFPSGRTPPIDFLHFFLVTMRTSRVFCDWCAECLDLRFRIHGLEHTSLGWEYVSIN